MRSSGKNGVLEDKHGVIKKVKRGRYQLWGENGLLIDSLTDLCSDEVEALNRMMSTALRHGSSISFVTEQLEKTKGDMNNIARATARVIKRYISDGSKVHGEACEGCGSENLARAEGCITCLSCGNSKCN